MATLQDEQIQLMDTVVRSRSHKARALLAWHRQKVDEPPKRPHRVIVTAAFLQCSVCRKVASAVASRNAFRRQERHGGKEQHVVVNLSTAHRPGQPVCPSVARGHILLKVAHYLFCERCGAFVGNGRAKNLLLQCPGQPRNPRTRTLRKRLVEGFDPFTGLTLQELPVPVDGLGEVLTP